MVMANQKFVIDVHTRKTKGSKDSCHERQLSNHENRTKKGEKRPAKADPKQLTKWQQEYTYQ